MNKPRFPQEKFLERIKNLQDEFGLPVERGDKTFDERVGLTNSLSRWKDGMRPDPESLLAIADHFHKSLDWLLGRATEHVLKEHSEVGYRARSEISQEAREEIKIRLKTYLAKNKISLDAKGEACMEVKLEDYYRDGFELPDDQVLKAYLLLCR